MTAVKNAERKWTEGAGVKPTDGGEDFITMAPNNTAKDNRGNLPGCG